MIEWVEINDHPWTQKPITYVDYLVFNGEDQGVAYINQNGEWCDSHSGTGQNWDPTHWMPLPEPPK